MAGKRGMKMSPNSLANLNPGGKAGNRGGGKTVEARETKQGFVDAMNAMTRDGDPKALGEQFRIQLAADLVNPHWRYQAIRQWWVEQQHGKPNAKVEHLLQDEVLMFAWLQALHDEGVEEDVVARVLERVKAVIVADPG